MKKTNYIILLGILFSTSVWGLTAQQAFEQGKALATQEKDITKQKGYINDAPNKVPGYVSTRQEESMFGGAELTSGAIAKQQGCAANPQQDGKVENHQECEAVNFLAGRPSTKSKSAFPDLSSDPSVIANKAVSQNIQSVLNQFGYSTTTSQTNCTNKTITNPAQYIENSCIEGNPVEAQSCTYGRTIAVDADSNYQCNQTVSSFEKIPCDDGDLQCSVTGYKLKCSNFSTPCNSYGGCCWVSLTCTSDSTGIFSWRTCCGDSGSFDINDISLFLSGNGGVLWWPSCPYVDNRIRCDNNGNCALYFQNAGCPGSYISCLPFNGPSSIISTFTMGLSPVISCNESGTCAGLEARTK